MKICDELTNPEDSAERRERRRVLAVIVAHGGCSLCRNRDPSVLAWGRSVCQANNSRSFPLCTKDGQLPHFQIDEARLQETR